MKPSIIILFFFLLAYQHSSLAQSREYEPGYILKNNDTISVLIHRSDEISLSDKILCKLNNNEISYLPTDLKGFGFTADNYAFETVEVILKSNLDSVVTFKFAKVLIKGPVSLYKVQLTSTELPYIYLLNNTFVYILKKEGVYYTLGQYEKLLDNYHIVDKKYIGIFRALFDDCPGMIDFDYDELEFNDKAVTKLTQAYNTCSNPEKPSTIFDYEIKSRIKHGPELGYSVVMFYSEDLTYSPTISLGYFWDITKPDLSRKNSFRLGINYRNQSYEYQKTKYSEHNLKFPILSQLNFGKHAQKNIPFLNFGLTGILSTDNGFNYLNIIPWLNIGTGIYINKLKLEFQLENETFEIKSNKHVSFSIGWRLDKAVGK